MADSSKLGKKAEGKIKQWLDRPEDNLYLWRLPDQMTGFYGSSNPCDFMLFKAPNFYLIESKATYSDRFEFAVISENQRKEMIKASAVEGVTSYILVLFASYNEAYLINIQDILDLEANGKKSLNIKKKDKWTQPYISIRSIPSRKELLDYDPEQAKEIF